MQVDRGRKSVQSLITSHEYESLDLSLLFGCDYKLPPLSFFVLQLRSTDPSVLSVNSRRGTVQGESNGTANIEIRSGSELLAISDPITVADDVVSILKLHPVVSSLRLTLNSSPESRLSPGSVDLRVLSTLFYPQERVEVSASAVLVDGRRIVIANPAAELNISSSNDSIVSVDGNFIMAEDNGVVEITVYWIPCNDVIAGAVIMVTVELDENRPQFEPDTQQAFVPENSSIGYSITTVTATDLDLDESDTSDIRYRILNPDPFNGLFAVNDLTGEVTLNGNLDRETRDQYLLIIEATDRQQRLAEREDEVEESGSGSGDQDILVPDSDSDMELVPDTTDVDPPARLNVSYIKFSKVLPT